MLLSAKYLFGEDALYAEGELPNGCYFEERFLFDGEGVEHQISNYILI